MVNLIHIKRKLQADCMEGGQLGGVQYEFNHKQAVYGTTPTIRIILDIGPGPVQL